jgi:hypothetical protein
MENYVGFEVVTTVDMKSALFWDIMACIPEDSTLPWKFCLYSYYRVTENPMDTYKVGVIARSPA